MNKPQYLAELGRLLIFMTAADREETLSRYGTLFDLAGPDGINDLISHIGSPTKAAIRLSRTYTPGSIADSVLDEPVPTPAKAPAAPEASVPVPEEKDAPSYDVPPLIMDDLPGYEPPVIPPNFEEDEPAAAPEEPVVPEGPAAPDAVRSDADDAMPDWMSASTGPSPDRPAAPDLPAGQPGPAAASAELTGTDTPDETPPAPAPAYTIERVIPLWAGIPLFVLSLAVIALPFGAVCLALVPVLVLPGVALLLGAWLAAVGGLWCISYIADAVMLFGLALVILAAGLVVLWLGLWLLVSIVSLYFRAMRSLTHLTLGKKVSVHA